jgi:hypothetical protein
MVRDSHGLDPWARIVGERQQEASAMSEPLSPRLRSPTASPYNCSIERPIHVYKLAHPHPPGMTDPLRLKNERHNVSQTPQHHHLTIPNKPHPQHCQHNDPQVSYNPTPMNTTPEDPHQTAPPKNPNHTSNAPREHVRSELETPTTTLSVTT